MNNTKVFLFASPNDAQSVLKITRNCTFFNYYIDKNGLLRRRTTPQGSISGLMYLSDYGIEDHKSLDHSRIARDIAVECRNRRFFGIFLDFEDPKSLTLLRSIHQFTMSPGFTLFVPISFAGSVPGVKLVVSSAISGGSFEQMLRELRAKYGAENLCLDIVRTCQDFTMPSYMPEGKNLSPEDFRQLLDRHSPSSFFSKDLCSKYFTYRTEGGNYHFVIYDDTSTALSKLELADSLGFFSAFILYSDFGDDVKHIINQM